MLGFLFRSLTAEPARGAPMFDAVTAIARQPHWYVDGGVPDTLDGRFAVLATITALVLVRLEQAGAAGNAASVALTERFIEVMESEHRELGLGDPALGRTVRKLVGSLSRRTDLWRETVAGSRAWPDSAKASLTDQATVEAIAQLEQAWAKLQAKSLSDVETGALQ